jgi:hypothetical protein
VIDAALQARDPSALFLANETLLITDLMRTFGFTREEACQRITDAGF